MSESSRSFVVFVMSSLSFADAPIRPGWGLRRGSKSNSASSLSSIGSPFTSVTSNGVDSNVDVGVGAGVCENGFADVPLPKAVVGVPAPSLFWPNENVVVMGGAGAAAFPKENPVDLFVVVSAGF